MGSIGESGRFRVRIFFREPTYHRAANPRESPAYSWTYTLEAASEGAARDLALQRFRKMEALSSVGWVREVIEAVVSPA